MQRKLILQTLPFIFFVCFVVSSKVLQANTWDFYHDFTNNVFSDGESDNGIAISGTLDLTAANFVQKFITSSTGTNAPATSTYVYGIEAPNFLYFQQPTAQDESQIIYSIETGSCVDYTFDMNWIFGQWKMSQNPSMTSTNQAAFGTGTYDPISRNFSISSIRNVENSSNVSWYSPLTIYGDPCVGGSFALAGATSEQSGKAFVSNDGGFIFRTDTEKTIVGVKRNKIINAASLSGTYSAFRYDAAASQTIHETVVTFDTSGLSATSEALDDLTNLGSTNDVIDETITVNAINSPVEGMFEATLTQGASNGKIVCARAVTEKTSLICTGQSPTDNTDPINFLMVGVQDRTPVANRGQGGINDNLRAITRIPGAGNDYFLGGRFTFIGGYDYYRIARVTTDGTINTNFNPGTILNNDVYSILLDSGGTEKVFLGGAFTNFDGTNDRIVRLNSDGSIDTSWAGDSDINSIVYDMQRLADGGLIAGGAMSNYGGTTKDRLIKFFSDGTIDTSFMGADNGPNERVLTVEPVGDGSNDFYIGGRFTQVHGTNMDYVARVQSDGTLITSFSTDTVLNNYVHVALAASDGSAQVYLGGTFTDAIGTDGDYIVRMNSDGSLDTSFRFNDATGFSNTINQIEYVEDGSGDLYVAGSFTNFNSGTQDRLARIDSSGSFVTSFNTNTGPGGSVTLAFSGNSAYTESDGGISVVGSFSTCSGSNVVRRCRFSSDGSLDTTVIADVEGFNSDGFAIAHLTDGSGDVYVGGAFVSYAGTSVGRFAKIKFDGDLDTSFNLFTDFNNSVRAVVVATDGSSDVYIGGAFSNYNGSADRIVRINSDGTQDTSFTVPNNAPNGTIRDILLATDGSDKIYIAGDFTTFNGTTVNHIARIDTAGNLDTSFNFTTSLGTQDIYDIAHVGDGSGDIVAGGTFTDTIGTGGDYLIKINSSGSIVTEFDIDYLNDTVFAVGQMHDTSGSVYVGGNFTDFSGTADRFAKILSDGSVDTSFIINNSANSSVRNIVQTNDSSNDIYITGTVTNYAGTAQNRLLRLNSDGTLDTKFQVGTGINGTGQKISVDPSGTGELCVTGGFTIYGVFGADRIICLYRSGDAK